MCRLNSCMEGKLLEQVKHLKMSLAFWGPRLIHWDCQALCLVPGEGFGLAATVLAISLIRSRGFDGDAPEDADELLEEVLGEELSEEGNLAIVSCAALDPLPAVK